MNRIALNTTEIALAADGAAPQWVELIPAADADGIVAGRDGRAWRFDAPAHQSILSAHAGLGMDVPVDWEHATQHRASEGGEAPAAGWVNQLEIRDGALWGQVEWTERAAQQIGSREYRYLSPVFDYDTTTRRIAQLVSVGLTNLPNLRLTALNQRQEPMMRSDALTAAIVSALGLKADASDDDVATALNSLKNTADTAQALNSQQPSLERFVPRADYDAALNRAETAELLRGELPVEAPAELDVLEENWEAVSVFLHCQQTWVAGMNAVAIGISAQEVRAAVAGLALSLSAEHFGYVIEMGRIATEA